MLVVVADDQQNQLKLVRRWFDRQYGKEPEVQLETCDDLDKLEDLIETKLSDDEALLLFLDLNWQEGSTRSLEWIRRIKTTTATQHWPVLVYSESEDRDDVMDAHKNLANGYVYKGTEHPDRHFVDILEHWRKRQLLPNEGTSSSQPS